MYIQILYGGEVDVEERYVAPTIITGATLENKVMQEEIFGELSRQAGDNPNPNPNPFLGSSYIC